MLTTGIHRKVSIPGHYYIGVALEYHYIIISMGSPCMSKNRVKFRTETSIKHIGVVHYVKLAADHIYDFL